MAVIVEMVFSNGDLDLYDRVMQEAGLVGATLDQVPGLIAHYAFERDGELKVIDVWNSADEWQVFTTEVIGAAAARAGSALQPDVTISEVHGAIPPIR